MTSTQMAETMLGLALHGVPLGRHPARRHPARRHPARRNPARGHRRRHAARRNPARGHQPRGHSARRDPARGHRHEPECVAARRHHARLDPRQREARDLRVPDRQLRVRGHRHARPGQGGRGDQADREAAGPRLLQGRERTRHPAQGSRQGPAARHDARGSAGHRPPQDGLRLGDAAAPAASRSRTSRPTAER